jgi:hypothetical protein
VATPREEKAYETYAWIIFLVLGILGVVGSLASFLVGSMSYHNAASAFPFLGFSVLVTAISFNSYRRGEKWAWYAFWINVVGLSLFYADGGFWADALLVVIVLLGLFLPYRKFFPKKQA